MGCERGASTRWAIAGAVSALLVGLVAVRAGRLAGRARRIRHRPAAPAGRCRGTVWSGSAVPCSPAAPAAATRRRCRAACNGRCRPRLRHRAAPSQACCLNGKLRCRCAPASAASRPRFAAAGAGWLGQWPAPGWRPGHAVEHHAARRRAAPRLARHDARIGAGPLARRGASISSCEGVSSRLSTLDTLGSYRLTLTGDAASETATMQSLTNADGALRLTGSGTWGPGGVRFRGEARAGGGRRGGAEQPAQHHRPAQRRAVGHFDRMTMNQRPPLRCPSRRGADGGGADAVARCRCRRRPPHGRRRNAAAPRGAPVTLNFVNADIEAVTRAMAAMLDASSHRRPARQGHDHPLQRAAADAARGLPQLPGRAARPGLHAWSRSAAC